MPVGMTAMSWARARATTSSGDKARGEVDLARFARPAEQRVAHGAADDPGRAAHRRRVRQTQRGAASTQARAPPEGGPTLPLPRSVPGLRQRQFEEAPRQIAGNAPDDMAVEQDLPGRVDHPAPFDSVGRIGLRAGDQRGAAPRTGPRPRRDRGRRAPRGLTAATTGVIR